MIKNKAHDTTDDVAGEADITVRSHLNTMHVLYQCIMYSLLSLIITIIYILGLQFNEQ